MEIAGLYWHFVDLVWIMVFTFMYLLEEARPWRAAGHKHPNYMAIFWLLAILTVVEIGVIFLPLTKLTIGVLLVPLALAKAALVAMYFMHLIFETRTLGLIAVTPLAIATLLVFVLLPDGFAVSNAWETTPASAAVRPRRTPYRRGPRPARWAVIESPFRLSRVRRRWPGERFALRCPRCGGAPLFRGWFAMTRVCALWAGLRARPGLLGGRDLRELRPRPRSSRWPGTSCCGAWDPTVAAPDLVPFS